MWQVGALANKENRLGSEKPDFIMRQHEVGSTKDGGRIRALEYAYKAGGGRLGFWLGCTLQR